MRKTTLGAVFCFVLHRPYTVFYTLYTLFPYNLKSKYFQLLNNCNETDADTL